MMRGRVGRRARMVGIGEIVCLSCSCQANGGTSGYREDENSGMEQQRGKDGQLRI